MSTESTPITSKEIAINVLIKAAGIDTGKISDGYHTFEELYEHRCQLFIALCRTFQDPNSVWVSQRHSDGTSIGGWFIMGINMEPGHQITYHLPERLYLPERLWDECCEFAKVIDFAPPWDGHSSQDVLKRLKTHI